MKKNERLTEVVSVKKLLGNRRFWVISIGFLFCAFIIKTAVFIERDVFFFITPVDKIEVLRIDDSNLRPDMYVEELLIGDQILDARILSGYYEGQYIRFYNVLRRDFNHQAETGDTLLVYVRGADGHAITADIIGYNRVTIIYLFGGLFVLILIVAGKVKGFYSVISLAFTLITILFFMLPNILQGHSPILLAIITAILTTVFNLFVVSDINLKSLSAIGGTFVGVTSAGILSLIFGYFARISGLQMAHAETIIYLSEGSVLTHQLLSAGIIISALGAVIDVAISMASSMFEIKEVYPTLEIKELYNRGMNIGRDIMGSTANTLILAFVGSSLSLMVMLALQGLPYLRIINLNELAVELIQGIAASIGLTLTVPATAFLTGLLATNLKSTFSASKK